MKYKLVVADNRLIGDLVFIKDRMGRWSMKLIFPHKVTSQSMFGEPERYQKSFPAERLLQSKIIPKGATFDLSYKFDNQKFEQKTESKDGIDRILYDVELPAVCPLFMLRVKDCSSLSQIGESEDLLNIARGIPGKDFVITFSFEADNGQPWIDELTTDQEHTWSTIPLPGLTPDKIHICVGQDLHPQDIHGVSSVWISHEITKDTGKK